jgi:hypothetical protein
MSSDSEDESQLFGQLRAIMTVPPPPLPRLVPRSAAAIAIAALFADDAADAAPAAASRLAPDPLPWLVRRSAPDPLSAAAPLRSAADATVDSWAHAAPAAFAWRSALDPLAAAAPAPAKAPSPPPPPPRQPLSPLTGEEQWWIAAAKRRREEDDEAEAEADYEAAEARASAAHALHAAAAPRGAGLGAALGDVVGEPQVPHAPQALQGRHGEVLVDFPDTASLGPRRDAWRDYREAPRSARVYRHFLPTDAYKPFRDFSNVGYASDGSPPINLTTGHVYSRNGSSGYPTVLLTIGDVNSSMKTHVAVAYLFGARKRTGYPMSLLLIVDHIAEGDKANFRLDNLQFVSQLQNAAKASNVKEVAKGKGAVLLPDGDAAGNGWYGELVPLYAFPASPTLGPRNDAWTDYRERVLRGINYRSFLPTHRVYGLWSHIGYASDGSKPFKFQLHDWPRGRRQELRRLPHCATAD